MSTDVHSRNAEPSTTAGSRRRGNPQDSPRGRWWRRGLLAIGCGRRGCDCRHVDPRRHVSAGVRPQADSHDHARRPGRHGHRTRDVGELQQYGNQVQSPRLQHRHLGDRGRYGGEGRRRIGQAGYEANRGRNQSANDECSYGEGHTRTNPRPRWRKRRSPSRRTWKARIERS